MNKRELVRAVLLRRFSMALAIAFAALVLSSCSTLSSLSSLATGGATKCSLDVTSVKSIHEFDFQEELELPEDASEKIEGVLVAIAELRGFVESVDRDLGAACADIAKDLGAPATPAPPPTPSASGAPVKATSAIEHSCADAGLRLKDAILAVVTEKTTISLEITPPHCSIDLRATASCAADCDESFDPKTPVGCEPGKLSPDGTCGGDLKLPEMSAECEAKCSVQANAGASCTPPKIRFKVEGGADPQKIEHLTAVVERGLTRVIHVAVAIGQRAIKLAGNVSGIAKDMKSAVEGVVKKMSSPREAARRGAKLAACLTPAFQGVIDTALKIHVDIAAAVSVKDALEGAVKRAAVDAKNKVDGAVRDARDTVQGTLSDAGVPGLSR